MATLVGLTGYTFGVASAETAVEIKNHTVNIAPQFKTFATDRVNSNKGFAVGPGRLTVSQQGDISATSGGWWDFTFATACTVANAKTYFGVGGTGGLYLDSASVVMASDAFKTVSMEFSLDAGIA